MRWYIPVNIGRGGPAPLIFPKTMRNLPAPKKPVGEGRYAKCHFAQELTLVGAVGNSTPNIAVK